jgi:RNA polymerase sigma factor for flagellar operon FliA
VSPSGAVAEGAARPIGTDDGDDALLWQAVRAEGSLEARDRLFSRHAAFAKSIAQRHHRERSYGDLEIADLRQMAYAGLLEAIDRFDPALNVPFRAFASHRISGSIVDGMSKMNEMREQVSWRHRLRHERLHSLTQGDADVMTTRDAMASLADLAVGLALGFMLEGTGMIASADVDGAQVPALRATAYDSTAWRELVDRLRTELSALPEREETLLRRHYMEGMSFEHLAQLLGVSRPRVSQIHRAALDLLRKRLASRGHFRLER